MTRREQHVRELAAELGVDLRIFRTGGPSGETGHKALGIYPHLVDDEPEGLGDHWAIVTGWDGRSQLGYFAALHELGHTAHGHVTPDSGQFRRQYTARILEAEAEAWDWALAQALEEPGPQVRKKLRTAWLASYVRRQVFDTAGPTYTRIASRFDLPAPYPQS